MRYKNLVDAKIEQLENMMIALRSILSTGSANKIENWFEVTREKIDEIKTLLNSEKQD
jgi:hypothetical protein